MKELSIEEKAERYDKSLERASNLYKDAVEMENSVVAKTCEIIFPQLKEPEDERIRKALISAINNICNSDEGLVTFNGFTKEQVLAWLEKQRGQKPAWNQEDIRMSSAARELITICPNLMASHSVSKSSVIAWLKSLKDKYTWKPSDAQMASITCAVRKMKESACYDSELVSVLNDLKKLKRE